MCADTSNGKGLCTVSSAKKDFLWFINYIKFSQKRVTWVPLSSKKITGDWNKLELTASITLLDAMRGTPTDSPVYPCILDG